MFENLKVGDKVTRMLAGTIPMQMFVSGLENRRIQCKPVEFPEFPDYYEFDPITGAEIDDDLGWGRLQTGSFIVRNQ